MLNPDFRDILSAFIDAGVEFLVVGGYAMAAHRLPRATKDLDLWVRPSAENAARVLQALDAFGAPRHGLTATDLETEGTIYQVGVPPNRVDVITVVNGVRFEDAWPQRADIEIDGVGVKWKRAQTKGVRAYRSPCESSRRNGMSQTGGKRNLATV